MPEPSLVTHDAGATEHPPVAPPALPFSRRPLIAVTGPAGRGHLAWHFTCAGLRLVGARSCRLTAKHPVPPEPIDGLLVGGGDDLDPGLYGGEHEASIRIDPDRDAFELQMLAQAREAKLPGLGICRGSQLLNVSRGGDLHGDISHMLARGRPLRTPLPAKTIRIVPDTRLSRLFGTETCQVNSLHHQAIDSLGEAVRVAARDTDDIIQAIEVPNERFTMGVQWHPEYLPQHRRQRALFRALVQAAEEYRDRRVRRLAGRAPHP